MLGDGRDRGHSRKHADALEPKDDKIEYGMTSWERWYDNDAPEQSTIQKAPAPNRVGQIARCTASLAPLPPSLLPPCPTLPKRHSSFRTSLLATTRFTPEQLGTLNRVGRVWLTA